MFLLKIPGVATGTISAVFVSQAQILSHTPEVKQLAGCSWKPGIICDMVSEWKDFLWKTAHLGSKETSCVPWSENPALHKMPKPHCGF